MKPICIERNGKHFKISTQTRKYTKNGQTGEPLERPRYYISVLTHQPFTHWLGTTSMTGEADTERKARAAAKKRIAAGEFD